MKAFKCKNTNERLEVLKILDKMGMEFEGSGKHIIDTDKDLYKGSLFLDSYRGSIWVLGYDNLSNTKSITTDLSEFLNQFRTKAYKCKSEEEKIHICKLLKENGVKVGEETAKGNISHPYIAYYNGADHIGGWKAFEYTGKLIEASTPAEFLKQWGIEWSKPIIGYKTPMAMFNGKIPKGTIYVINNLNKASYMPNNSIKLFNPHGIYALPKEIVETWEPVYKEVDTEFDMGGFKLTVNSQGIFHKSENITRFCGGLHEAFNNISKGIAGYNVGLKEVIFSQTGCEKSETTLTKWLDVYEKYLNIKGV